MKVILPVAGRGSRLRPWTDTVPKPLLRYQGKMVLSHILERLLPLDISEYLFVTGYRGEQVHAAIRTGYPRLPVTFIEQSELKGVGHAIYQVRKELGAWEGSPLLIILGDVLIETDFEAFVASGSTRIGVRSVLIQKPYGVVSCIDGCVVELQEKPQEVDMAIAGCYFIREVDLFFECLETLIEKQSRTNGEYQLTDALQLMVDRDVKISVQDVDLIEWEAEYR